MVHLEAKVSQTPGMGQNKAFSQYCRGHMWSRPSGITGDAIRPRVLCEDSSESHAHIWVESITTPRKPLACWETDNS